MPAEKLNKTDLPEALLYLPGKTAWEQEEWLPLWIHLTDTAGVISYLAEHWVPEQMKAAICRNFPPEQFSSLCIFLALTHDIGKMTPVMARKLLPTEGSELEERLLQAGLRIPDRASFGQDFKNSPHALAGEAILLKKGCPDTLAVIVGAHHGKPQGMGESKHQLEKYDRNYYGGSIPENGTENIWDRMWDEWISYSLIESGFASMDELPDVDRSEQMLLSGLLIMADWIASNTSYFPLITMDEDEMAVSPQERIESGLEALHLPGFWDACQFYMDDDAFSGKFGFRPNPMQEAVIQAIEDCREPGLFILEAPMGSGKTEAALAAAEILATRKGCGGLFFGLPTQATANGIFPRLEQWAQEQSEDTVHAIRLAHGMAELNDSYRALFSGSSDVADDYPEDGLITHEWFKGRKQALLSEFVIGTIDQLLLAALKQKHVMLRHLGLAGKVIILDEVHSFDAYMSQYLERALRWLGEYGTPVIMLSATLPAGKREKMVEAYLGRKNMTADADWQENRSYPLLTWTDGNCVCQKTLPADQDSRVIRIEEGTDQDVPELLKDALREGGCAGVILNTVKRAQDTAAMLREKLPDKEVVLFHAGFVATDRAQKEKTVLERAGKASSQKDRDGLIIVGTQVLEQSLDIDFDFMITDLCPMDLLLQRIGRLQRHDRKRPENLKEAVCVVLGMDGELDKGSERVYGRWLLLRTRELLPDQITLPDSIPELVQDTYEEAAPETLEDQELKDSWDSYELEIRKKEEKAKVFQLMEPSTSGRLKKKFTIRGLLDTDVKDSGSSERIRDTKAQAMVRDSDPSLEVLVMVRDHDGNVGFLPWQEENGYVATDRPPSEEESIRIARQRLRLPRVLCYPSVMDRTVKELEEKNRAILPEWQSAPMLRGELIMLLDEELSAVIGEYRIRYDREDGISYEKLEGGVS